MRKGFEIAVRIGNRHAQMFAKQSQGFWLTAAGRYPEAEELQAGALEQARALNARRYEAVILAQQAEVALCKGRKSEAAVLARAGQEISDEIEPRFVGPIIHGLVALTADARDEADAALAAGEALLAKGAFGHNHFWFRRYAIESALLREDWTEAERQADALLRTSRSLTPPVWRRARMSWRGAGGGTRPRRTRKNSNRRWPWRRSRHAHRCARRRVASDVTPRPGLPLQPSHVE